MSEEKKTGNTPACRENRAKPKTPLKKIKQMKDSKVDRPEQVKTMDWNQPEKLKEMHHVIARLNAAGASNRFIAETVGMSESRISVIINGDLCKAQVAEIRKQLFPDFKDRVKKYAEEAIDVVHEIMIDETNKPGVRLSAAQDFMDRAHGRATQTIEHGSTLLRELYEAMEKKKRLQLEEPAKQKNVSAPVIIDAVPVQEKPTSEIDSWVESNL